VRVNLTLKYGVPVEPRAAEQHRPR